MVQKLAILSGFVLSASCMVLHQAPISVLLTVPPRDNSNYNFAYEVNDLHTGDIKSQQETRRGDAVLGQYSILQPDGVRRTVDYRADDHTGFQATVNNDRQGVHPMRQEQKVNENRDENEHERNSIPQRAQTYQPEHIPHLVPNSVPTPPIAISRSSTIHQTFPNVHPWL